MQQAAIFVRVSKREQDYQRQLEDLRVVARSQSVQVVAEISEKISGVRTNQERSGIQELLQWCRQGTIQKVLVCEVSRLGRSTVEVLQVVDELTRLSISIYVHNFGIETLKNDKRNPVAQFMFTLLAGFARLERETLRERILSGMEEARRQGKKIGRPKGVNAENLAKARTAPDRGLLVAEPVSLTGIRLSTVKRWRKLLG